jgi:hypothetical protein
VDLTVVSPHNEALQVGSSQCEAQIKLKIDSYERSRIVISAIATPCLIKQTLHSLVVIDELIRPSAYRWICVNSI